MCSLRVGLTLGWLLLALSCRDAALPHENFQAPAEAPPEPPATSPGSSSQAAGGASDSEEARSTSAGAGVGPLSRVECQAEAVTLRELAEGRVKQGSTISVDDVVASSQKFLVSAAQSGNCLWGAFVASRELAGAAFGLLLVSFGAPRTEGAEHCVSGSDGLPDDLEPGERVQARGIVSGYAPSDCDHVVPALQLRVDVSCPLTRLGAGEPPEPEQIDLELAGKLASGDQASLKRWGGALVRLPAVSVQEDAEDGDGVFPFGVVRLQETALEVHSRLHYFDLSQGGPRSPQKAPRFGYPTQFESATGLVFLDYCQWVLAPRNSCADLPTTSGGCGRP
jgi:hypothetical protein